MRVFFDNCTPPWLASTLDGFISHLGHHAFHIKDVAGLSRSATDLEWIQHLKQGKDWIFVSGDLRLTRNRAERTALRTSGLYGFLLGTGYQKMPEHHFASNLIWKWPEIENVMQAVRPGIFEVPVNRGSKLATLPL